MDTVCAVGMHYWHVFSCQAVDLKIRSWRWRRWARTSLRQPRCFGRWSWLGLLICLFIFGSQKKKKKSELLNIRDTLPDCFCPKILSSAEYILLSDLKPKQWDCAMETQGRWAGTLVRFRRRGLRAPLPGIFLPNVLSLANKTDQLQLLTKNDLYSPCEFASVILAGDYIALSPCTHTVQQLLVDQTQITELERKHPDSTLNIMGILTTPACG